MSAAIVAKTLTQGADSPAMDDLKPWKTAQAEALLAGFSAVLTDSDEGQPMIVVSRWALTRSFTDLAELRIWLERVRPRA